jgi:hypothetical protein
MTIKLAGSIIKYNSKGVDAKTGYTNKYDNILVKVDTDKTDMKQLGDLKIKESRGNQYVSLNVVSVSKVDKTKLNNEHYGTFIVDVSKTNIWYIKEAELESIF